MAGFDLFNVQKAIDSTLTGDSTLTNLLGDGVNGILDNGVQTNAITYPYIVYSGSSSQNWDTKSTNGSETIITLTAYSKTGDKEEISDIISRVHELLHNSTLTVSGTNFVLCRWDGLSEIFVDDSSQGRIHQGVIRFRVNTQG